MGTLRKGKIKMNIGITLAPSKTQFFVNQTYINYIAGAGFQPRCIVPAGNLDLQLENLDGLLIPGGIDLDPIYYGDDNDSSIGADPIRDSFEREVFHRFRKMKKPIFGICRGFQLIVRELLLEDISLTKYVQYVQHIDRHNQESSNISRSFTQHYVSFRKDLLLGEDDWREYRRPVNSMHHQGVIVDFKDKSVLGFRSFRMAAWTDRGIKYNKDTPSAVLCEAFRILGWEAPILAVQWHPEELFDINLIQNFFTRKGNINYDRVLTVETKKAMIKSNKPIGGSRTPQLKN